MPALLLSRNGGVVQERPLSGLGRGGRGEALGLAHPENASRQVSELLQDGR